ncbi:DNA-binding IclR family transcriptional regulator [Lipingzhangella halophila]|uniref:DNA-binding IclR family transcriptional regulator n=1 Tax=Lipingzhangella halophila TaxID=1783352 RepID=A0A7W7RMR0_9ACTN|nr:IclR family transcriptional regulator [Lipingzhangella halophila]MBB4934865.1 DNA-binding IclR family transcriptional regulator [Lipingzhangella halophila]
MARSASGESVLERVVRIIEAFEPATPVLTVSEISRSAALPLATTARLVKEMAEHGLLHRDEERRVRIGTRMWELAERASPMQRLRETAVQYMGDLQAAIGHSTQLGVLDGNDVLFVERLSAPESVTNVTQIAGRLPVNASSVGLVLLANAPSEVARRVLRSPLRGYTANTITDEWRLRRELAEVRQRGFAFCPGHIHPDATGIAVPVHRNGKVVAGLGVVVPNDDQAWALHRTLLVTGMALSREVSGPASGTDLGTLIDTRRPVEA